MHIPLRENFEKAVNKRRRSSVRVELTNASDKHGPRDAAEIAKNVGVNSIHFETILQTNIQTWNFMDLGKIQIDECKKSPLTFGPELDGP